MPESKPPVTKEKRIEELIFVTIPQVISGWMFLVAVIINIVNVIGRYVFHKPLYWAEETLIFMVIWMVFMLAGSVTYRGAHLNMDLVYSILPRSMKRVVNIAVAAALIVCPLFVAYEASLVVALQYRNHGVTAGTEIPLVIPTAALVFGFAFISFAALVRFRSYVIAGSKFD
jgi:TRAP-type C4-dicarboxylate transport system permease small subunit